MRADCLKMKILQLNNIRSGGQERSFKSRTCHSQGRCTQAEKRASRTIGTFGFCLDTKPKAEKPKEPNFSQRSTETRILTERNKRYK